MGDSSMGHSLFHATIDEESGEDQQHLISPTETVHREHLKHHVHSHKHIHRRQSPADTSAAITEVTSTVSVIEQVDVDTNGSIFSTQDVPQASTTLPATTDATTSIEPSTTFSIAPNPSASVAASTSVTSAIISTSQPTSDLTSIPSTAATTTFATITTGSNATLTTDSTTSSGSLFSTSNFSSSQLNSTTSSSSSSSTSSISVTSSISSGLIPTTSATFSDSSTILISSTQSSLAFSSTSSLTFESFSQTGSSSAAFTDGIGATGTQTSNAATSSATSGAGDSSSDGLTPPTSTVIASVFGGIAGLGVMLVFLLFLIKWHKRRLASNRGVLGGSSDEGARDSTTPVNPSSSGGMSQRMSQRARFAIPAGLANLGSFKPNRASRQTMGTVSSTAGSERGFVRVSGRKIRSVLESGGDGYGDPPDLNMNIDGASFFHDSQGFHGGPGSPASPAAGRRGSGIPNLRPSPARTPVIAHGAFPDLVQPPPSRPDAGGRSRSGSNTGSHVSASRFTENV